jgi:hypothetical protein
MTRLLVASLAAGLLSASAGATAAIQQTPPPTPAIPQTPATDATLVGCIVQGSSAQIFLFENAVDPETKGAKPQTFKVVSQGEELDFKSHVNHRVQIVGVAETKTPPPPPLGGRVDEKDLPVLTVKTISHVATTCSASGR